MTLVATCILVGGRAKMQNESSVNKKVLRYFENSNKYIIDHAGSLSLRVWFLISVLVVIVVGNGLMLFISTHAVSSVPVPARSRSIFFDRGSVTTTVEGNHTMSQQQKSSIGLPHVSVVPTMQIVPKDGGLCAYLSH